MAVITANDLARMLKLQKKWSTVIIVNDEDDWAILSNLPAEKLASLLRYLADLVEDEEGWRDLE